MAKLSIWPNIKTNINKIAPDMPLPMEPIKLKTDEITPVASPSARSLEYERTSPK